MPRTRKIYKISCKEKERKQNRVLAIKKRWRNDKSVLSKKDNILITSLRNNPFGTTRTTMMNTNFPGSKSKVGRPIRKSDIRNRVAAKKPVLTEQHKQAGLSYALNHINHDLICNQKSKRFSVNVWGWVNFRGAGVCWRIDEKFTKRTSLNILENVMLPSIRELFPENDFIYQQDTCPFIKQQHNNNTSTSEDLPAAAVINNNASTSEDLTAAELINNNVSTSEDLPAAEFINNNASTSEDPTSTANTPVVLVASEGEAVDREEKAFCVVCGMESTGTHVGQEFYAIYAKTKGI
ncbi:hypothetical protein ILUMI_12578 [Ignelater luminosus]|uniref:Uncharacterized protein n=1 Tax=Ignelater luminosus TaxID=2038154 RepID=A0A8K0GC69_IGNLU|nr:hypothetical protein ILUMI_12578 [Ignelater luminosus]